MRDRESEREKRGERNTKGNRDGAKICGYGRQAKGELVAETMAKWKIPGPPLRLQMGNPEKV